MSAVLRGGRQDFLELPKPCSVIRAEMLFTLEGLEKASAKQMPFSVPSGKGGVREGVWKGKGQA